MCSSSPRFATLFLLAALLPPIAPADAAGKAYVFLGGHLGNLKSCADQLSVHSKGDAGAADVNSAVSRTRSGETIVVAGHSDGSIFASSFLKAVKQKDPNAKIRYVNFEGFRPNGGGRPDVGYSNVKGLPGLEITCVTMPGAPNFSFLKPETGCKMAIEPVPEGCNSWCRHYAVMNCKYLK